MHIKFVNNVRIRTARPAGAAHGPDLSTPRRWYAPDGDGGAGSDQGGSGQQGGQGGAQGQQGQGDGGTPPPETWEEWLAERPEAERGTIQKLYETHTTGLRTALDNERDERKRLAKEMQAAADKLKDGDASKEQLTKMADDLNKANAKADFFQEAARPEIGLADAEAAWIIVQAKGDAFKDRKGNIDFELLKASHPGLFRQEGTPKPPKGNAGDGVINNQQPSTKSELNSAIRRAAGYQT
jgi:hypothetical protein